MPGVVNSVSNSVTAGNVNDPAATIRDKAPRGNVVSNFGNPVVSKSNAITPTKDGSYMSAKAEPFIPSTNAELSRNNHRITHNLKLESLDDKMGQSREGLKMNSIDEVSLDGGSRDGSENNSAEGEREEIRLLKEELAKYRTNLEEERKRNEILVLQYKNDKVS